MKKRILILLMCLCIVGAVVLICEIAWIHNDRENQHDDLESLRDQLKQYQTMEDTDSSSVKPSVDIETEAPVVPEADETISEETTIPESTETETEPPETETEAPETEPVKPIEALLDFESMWKINTDICAWIEIDGTLINYPILQNPVNDNKYLNTGLNGSYYIGGSLFTQATYNSNDFNDPVTVVYGHTMRAGTLFGQLQSTYSSSQGFKDHSEIKLYLPDEVRYYTVFAAVPYSSMHILDAYDFSNAYWYENFFDGVMDIREFGAQFNENITPEPGDRVIVLSTCLNEDSTKRFLVMAIYQDDMK